MSPFFLSRLFPPLVLLLALMLTGPTAQAADVEMVCFTPGDQCDQLLRQQIEAASQSILVQAYGFTSDLLAQSLIAAAQRGVRVEVILDKSNCHGRHSQAIPLTEAGIPVRIDEIHGIAHNKVMVIDGELVVTGSYNFTSSAQVRNAENLIILRDPDLAAHYSANWDNREDASYPLDIACEIPP